MLTNYDGRSDSEKKKNWMLGAIAYYQEEEAARKQ
jgi:hypothetical protein